MSERLAFARFLIFASTLISILCSSETHHIRISLATRSLSEMQPCCEDQHLDVPNRQRNRSRVVKKKFLVSKHQASFPNRSLALLKAVGSKLPSAADRKAFT
jgi:hypothetical protein